MMTAGTAAHAVHGGIEALLWALETGLITQDEFDEAELAFDACYHHLLDAISVAHPSAFRPQPERHLRLVQ